jgi:thymidylate synthase (FAD)
MNIFKTMKNKVELLGYYGSDETIACSAWTSTSRALTPEKKQRIPALLDMLWGEGHHTPYEKCSLHFLVDTDIASHIHLLKHRISSLNAESARYKELKDDKYYIPEDWEGIKAQSVKPLYYFGARIDVYDKMWTSVLDEYTALGNDLYHRALADLQQPLGRKRAKESARFFKTYNSQIQADVQFNLRSFANFLKLRNSEHAQVEIREIAQEMLRLMETIEGDPFKYTLEAWKKHNTAPSQ